MVERFLAKVLLSIAKTAAGFLWFFDSHFTYLAILLLVALGTAMNFLLGYLCRYSKYDWWEWKGRATFKSIRLCVSLLLLKGVLQILR